MTWAEADQGSMGLCLFEDRWRYIENSPFYRADKIHTPLLLIHGKFDDAATDAAKLFSALRRLKRPAELVIYNKGHHTLREMRLKDHKDAVLRILDFFNRHLNTKE
jgi:dipeptidyl aminopeptidase/acylaminoacyl peptidase